jgi:DNA polymerase-3 subunit delta'
MHHALVALCDGERTLRLTHEELDWLQKFAQALNLKLVEKIAQTLDEAWMHVERNVNGKMVFLDTSFLIAEAVTKKKQKKQRRTLRKVS